jgi:hypothetical protein
MEGIDGRREKDLTSDHLCRTGILSFLEFFRERQRKISVSRLAKALSAQIH